VIGVNRAFLLQALEADDQLTLGLDDPIAPLAIRNPHQDGALSILMPVRLDQPA
jgi:DNA polymerase III sliding clamp (beta) subunit (PCNA family)